MSKHSLLVAHKVLKPATVKSLLAESLRAQLIADRWASASPKKVREMERDGTLLPRLREQANVENRTIVDARTGGAMSDVPDSEILALNDIPLLLEDEHGGKAPDSLGELEGSGATAYNAIKELARAWPDILAGESTQSAEQSVQTYSVLVIDMFHHGDPDEEITVSGFKTLDAAREYARRRTRDSLENFRAETKSLQELRDRWFAYGEDCIVIQGDYAGSSELDKFLQQPATEEERDWASLKPK